MTNTCVCVWSGHQRERAEEILLTERIRSSCTRTLELRPDLQAAFEDECAYRHGMIIVVGIQNTEEEGNCLMSFHTLEIRTRGNAERMDDNSDMAIAIVPFIPGVGLLW